MTAFIPPFIFRIFDLCRFFALRVRVEEAGFLDQNLKANRSASLSKSVARATRELETNNKRYRRRVDESSVVREARASQGRLDGGGDAGPASGCRRGSHSYCCVRHQPRRY